MSKLSRVQVNSITENISSDSVELRRLYRAKKQDTLQISVMHNLVEDYLKGRMGAIRRTAENQNEAYKTKGAFY